MEITQVELFPIHTPRETGFVSPHTTVKMYTNADITGIGEMSDLGHLSTMPDVPQMACDINVALKGVEVRDTPVIDAQVKKLGEIFGTGIEMAALDVKGKALNLPVYELLGGAYTAHGRKLRF